MKRKLLPRYETLEKALTKLTDYLIEAHEDEIRNSHFGDGAKGCTYCKEISKARKILRRIEEARTCTSK